MSEDERLRDLEILRKGCSGLGISLGPSQEHQIVAYLELLYVWNRAAGLTTIARGDAMRVHCLDSLAALDMLGEGPCLDLGTGAGLPGMVLAIADGVRQFVLVESNRRRCSFLLEAVRLLGLRNVKILERAVETLAVDCKYPTVISRAFRPPAEFLAIAAIHVQSGGRVVLMMADVSDDELLKLQAASGMKLQHRKDLRLPGGPELRTLACFFG